MKNFKTVAVVFQNQGNASKRYFFNTIQNLKVGDIIQSPQYDTPMRVVQVFDDAFRYCNAKGEIYGNIHEPEYIIKELIVEEHESQVVYGKIIKQ